MIKKGIKSAPRWGIKVNSGVGVFCTLAGINRYNLKKNGKNGKNYFSSAKSI